MNQLLMLRRFRVLPLLAIFSFIFSILAPLQGLAEVKSPIVAEMEYIVIRPTDEGSVAFMHMTTIKNLQEQIYRGDGTSKAVLSIDLPKGATKLQVHDPSLGMEKTPNGFSTMKEIPPFESIVLPYSYRLESTSDGYTFQYPFPVQVVQILIPEGAGSLKIKGVDYTEQGLFEFQGQKYYGYSIIAVEPKKSFSLFYDPSKQPSINGTENQEMHQKEIKTKDQSPSETKADTISLTIFAFFALVCIVGIGVYLYFQRKNKILMEKQILDAEEEEFLELISKQEYLTNKILVLEQSDTSETKKDENNLAEYKVELEEVTRKLEIYIE